MASIDTPDSPKVLSSSVLHTLRRRHQAFAASRRFAHISRTAYLQRLDGHAASHDSPLLICAPSGTGKSALVAYWAEQFRGTHEGACVIEHYVGCGDEGVSRADVIRHVMLELRERFSIATELPETPERLVKDFPAWLWFGREPVVLILDALDQLHDADRGLDWLPDNLPPTVRLIATTADPAAAEELRGRGWSVLMLEPFTLAERRSLVRRFVHEKKAGLTAAQQRAVVSDAGSANPLLLRTRLEEARAAGTDRNADEAIGYYLGATTVEEMYERLLGRLESELEPGTAREVLSLLCAVKSGLSIAEIAEIAPLSSKQIVAVVERLDAYLLDIENRLSLFHVSLGRAAAHRWPEAHAAATRLRLADYFASIPRSVRSAQEVIFQLTEAREWRRLVDFLTDVPTFLLCFEHLQYELLLGWQRIDSSFDIVEEYSKGLEQFGGSVSPDQAIEAMRAVGKFFTLVGRMEGAREAYAGAYELACAAGLEHMQATLQTALGNVAASRGECEEAETLLERGLAMLRRLGNPSSIANVTIDLGRVAYIRGDLIHARELFEQSLEVARMENQQKEEVRSLSNLAVVYVSLGDLRNGADCFRQVLSSAEQAGDILMETAAVNNLGFTMEIAGNLDEAYRMYCRSRDLAAAVGDRRQLAIAHGNLGNLLTSMQRPQEALEEYMHQMRLADATHDRRQVAAAWSNIGDARTKIDEYTEALTALDRALCIYEDIGDEYGAALVHGRLGYLRLRSGDSRGATECFQREREIGERMSNAEFVMESALGVGHAHLLAGDLDRAEEAYHELGRIAEENGSNQRSVESTGWLAVVAGRRGERDAALGGLDSAIAASRKKYPSEDHAMWLLEKGGLLVEVPQSADANGSAIHEEIALQDAADCIRRVKEMPIYAADQRVRERADALHERIMSYE